MRNDQINNSNNMEPQERLQTAEFCEDTSLENSATKKPLINRGRKSENLKPNSVKLIITDSKKNLSRRESDLLITTDSKKYLSRRKSDLIPNTTRTGKQLNTEINTDTQHLDTLKPIRSARSKRKRNAILLNEPSAKQLLNEISRPSGYKIQNNTTRRNGLLLNPNHVENLNQLDEIYDLKTLSFALNLIKIIKQNEIKNERRNGQVFTSEKLNELIGKFEENYSKPSTIKSSGNNHNYHNDSASQSESDSNYLSQNEASKLSNDDLKSKTTDELIKTKRSNQ